MIPRRLDNRRRPLSQEIMFYDNILRHKKIIQKGKKVWNNGIIPLRRKW